MKQITKDDMERMCRRVGVVPVARKKIAGEEIFIADGAVSSAQVKSLDFKFPGTSESFPGGCYMTMFLISRREDKMADAQPLFFELLHDSHLSRESKQLARINAALQQAERTLAMRKKARH